MGRILSILQALRQPENTALVRSLLADPAISSRAQLVQEVCQRLDLLDPKGDWRVGTTMKALRKLESEGWWKLPPPKRHSSGQWNPSRLDRPVPAPVGVPARAQDVGGLELVVVSTKEEGKLWNELILREHPLQQCRLVGRQLRYLIGSEHGWLGAIGFGSAALYLESRDEWIGWTAAQRLEHLSRVVQMTRFLIRPHLRCENLASHVLRLCVGRVAEDFERRYGLRPWLLESFVDTAHHEGKCYQAANWIHVGQSKGRGRNGARNEGKSLKDIYLYGLVEDLRHRLGVRPLPVVPLEAASGLEADTWAQQEFGQCELGDPRRTRRLVRIVGEQAAVPGGSYAQATRGNRHTLKGYYRLLNNKREDITPESLLQTHRAQTLRRMKRESTVLILQDTTELNFSTRSECEGLGQLGTNQTGTKSRGLNLHSSLAVAGGDSGLPLGVLRLDGYAPESAKGKDPDRPIQQKESYRWLEAYEDACRLAARIPETRVINVTDREGDMFELFDRQRTWQGPRAELLVRAQHDRCLEGSDRKLFEELAATPPAKRISIAVPRQRERRGKPSAPGRVALPARIAKVEIRFKRVSVSPPQTPQTRHKPPLDLWVVTLVEKHPPPGATALNWILLTSIPLTSLKQALQCIRWYCRRWRIEEWHRVMKSGCQILDHQNNRAHVLLRAIALDAVIAWRIMLLTLLGREVPQLPADTLFDPCECEVLELLTQKKNSLSLGEAMIAIARLGGYLNRRCDGPPGFESLWGGYARFHDMVWILRLSRIARTRGP